MPQCTGANKQGDRCKNYAKEGYSTCHNHHRECSVCYDRISIEKEVQLSLCKHYFCTSCIKTWLETYKNTCPFCRSTISLEDINKYTSRKIIKLNMTPGMPSGIAVYLQLPRYNIIGLNPHDMYASIQGILGEERFNQVNAAIRTVTNDRVNLVDLVIPYDHTNAESVQTMVTHLMTLVDAFSQPVV